MATHKPVGRDVPDAPFCTSSHHGSRVVEDADPYKF